MSHLQSRSNRRLMGAALIFIGFTLLLGTIGLLLFSGGFLFFALLLLPGLAFVGFYFLSQVFFRDPEKQRTKIRNKTKFLLENQPSSDSFYLSLSKKNRLDPLISQKQNESYQEIVCPHCNFLNQLSITSILKELSCSSCKKRIVII
ncbi:MAG: hypothetical protein ACXAB7_13315 [Candidatus Kariarchaeaceae archaeon]